MKIDAVELRRLQVPLRSPWRTAYGVEQVRDLVLVRVRADESDGWGECGALGSPGYSPEWADGAYEVLRRFLVPAVLASSAVGVAGNEMAKAALEAAVLDAQLRADGVALA